MVDIVKQFAADNQIADVFVAEQTQWHTLTNRVGEGVADYFQRTYMKSEKEVVFPYNVSSEGASIEKMYRLK